MTGIVMSVADSEKKRELVRHREGGGGVYRQTDRQTETNKQKLNRVLITEKGGGRERGKGERRDRQAYTYRKNRQKGRLTDRIDQFMPVQGSVAVMVCLRL